MKIQIKSIPHKEQRYETTGDYYVDKDKTLNITISKQQKQQYEYLIAIHELIELTLVIFRGISIKSIDEFDQKFVGEGEPGDSTNAPYYAEHQIATKVEKMICKELNIPWEEYLESTP